MAKGILLQGTVTAFFNGEDGLFHPEWIFINLKPTATHKQDVRQFLDDIVFESVQS
jgi:hypothetical protein